MSEIKFACPSCGQHLSATEAHLGLTIACPSCQGAVKVPGAMPVATSAPPPLPPPQANAMRMPPPPPPPRMQIPAPPPTSTTGAPPRAVTPAKSRSKTGLIIGLAIAALFVFLLILAAGVFFLRPIATRQQPNFPVQTSPGRTYSREPQVETDASRVQIAGDPVSGTLHGTPFQLKSATLNNNILHLQGKDFYEAIMVFTFLKGSPEGKTLVIPRPASSGYEPVPHVHLRFKEGQMPRSKILSSSYSMRLEFGREENGMIPGKIYFESPAADNTKVEGEFAAKVGSATR